MKWIFMAAAICVVGLSWGSADAQSVSEKAENGFQVKKNVRITDASTRPDEIKIGDIKLFEDGAEQEITGLSNKPSPLYLEIVIDDSGSMQLYRNLVKEIGKFIVQNISDESQVQIVRFANHDQIQAINDWSSDKQLLTTKFEEVLAAGGDSPVFDSILAALEQIRKVKELPGDKRFAVVLISDCGEGGSRHSESQFMQELAKADVPLFVVGLTEPPTSFAPDERVQAYVKAVERFAHNSALVSGGSVYFPRKGANAKLPLAESLKPLSAELRSEYVLTYTPTNQNADGKERSVRVEVADSIEGFKRMVEFKPLYIVTAPR